MAMAIFGELFACAFDVVHVKQTSAKLKPVTSNQHHILLTEDIDVAVGTGFLTKLKAGTKWNLVGKLEYGDVYRTNDQIVTVEGSNIYEAYIVVSGKQLVGFYLPAEEAFSPISPKKLLSMEKSKKN
jgi:hypothetical protein